MLTFHYSTKKDLKASKGKELRFSETSMFGNEYPSNGNGKVTGTNHPKRSWFATVTLEDHKIVKVS